MESINLTKRAMHYVKPMAFEKFIGALFESLGYHIQYEKKLKDESIDMLITDKSNESLKYICEIKYYSKPRFSPGTDAYGIANLSKLLSKDQKGLFITTSLCTPELRKDALEKNIIILDITNLIYLVKPNQELYQYFLQLIDFSIEKFEPKKPLLEFSIKTEDKKDENMVITWKEKLKSIKPGKENFLIYEKTCVEILKLLFSDYLGIWQEQQKSNDSLYRFDLICKIKNDVNDDFFSTINTYFNTRYIVFDFKNYNEKITQKEIYTTEKYLYDKALRKVAILISRKGIDENALKAIKGSLREQGKVILSLTDDDIIFMINMHYEGDNPADYLSMKLDKLLIELEK